MQWRQSFDRLNICRQYPSGSNSVRLRSYSVIIQIFVPLAVLYADRIWRARDDVERKFRNAPAHDVVETANAGRKFVVRDLTWLAYDFLRQFAFGRVIAVFLFFLPLSE